MKYYVWTEGCQMNVADSQRVAAALEGLGYEATNRAEEADVVCLNTCVVRQSAEDKAYGRLTSLRPVKTRRPDVVINLMGCLVGIKGNPALAQAFPFVDVFSPPSDPRLLVEFLLQRQGRELTSLETATRYAAMDDDRVLPLHERGQLAAAHVSAVHGCSHACTYCVIPYRRGIEQSRAIEAIVAEIRTLAGYGVREVTLLGQIVDRYGKDLPGDLSLARLLREVHGVDGIERIRFLTSHPNWMDEGLLETVCELPKVCEHIEVPVQAGDDAILSRMKRGYTADHFRRLVERIRRKMPDVAIATDVMVGFPGETDLQFRHTYDLLAELRLDVVHIARYSPRPGTLAARRFEDDVPEAEKMGRFRALEDLQSRIAAEINRGVLGRTVEVLVEGEHRGRWRGRTRGNKLVFFEAGGDQRRRLAQVEITRTGPWSMFGVPADSGLGRSAQGLLTSASLVG